MRYVDDVRLFGSSEDEVRKDLIELESHCRERGLIPQTGKFAIKRAQNVQDAMGMLPSISDPQGFSQGEVVEAFLRRNTPEPGLSVCPSLHERGLRLSTFGLTTSGRSFWLSCQNSFNQTVFLALQRHLAAIGHAASCTITDKKGQLGDFGVTLDANGPFSTNCPTIGD